MYNGTAKIVYLENCTMGYPDKWGTLYATICEEILSSTSGGFFMFYLQLKYK